MILLALCLIKASANYYFKIKYYDENNKEHFSSYIEVKHVEGQTEYDNGLRKLLKGETVLDESKVGYTLPKTTDGVDLDKIEGIVFANEKGRNKGTQENILEGDEYKAWEKIRPYIKFLELREYKCDTYNNSGYFMNMHKVEALELPKDGMTVGDGVEDGQLYFANADNLKKIYIWINQETDKVEITNDRANNKTLLNRVGKEMFSNCYSLSTKYIKMHLCAASS